MQVKRDENLRLGSALNPPT